MHKLLKLAQKFNKIAQNRRRVVYDRDGVKPRPEEIVEQETVSNVVNPGSRWDSENLPAYSPEDFKDFSISLDYLEPEVTKSYTPAELKYEPPIEIDPVKKKEEEQRLRKETLQDNIYNRDLLSKTKSQRLKEQPAYSKMMQREREDREARQKAMEARQRESEMREAEFTRLQEEAFNKEPWKYYRNELGRLEPKDPDEAKSWRDKIKKEPWKYVIDKDGNITTLSEEEATASKKEYDAKREEEKILKQQKSESDKEKKKTWDFEELSDEEKQKRIDEFVKNNPDEARVAMALKDFIKKTRDSFQKLGIETTFKKPTPKKSRTEKDKYILRDESGSRPMSVERPGEVIEDWITIPIMHFSAQDKDRATKRPRNVYVKLNTGTRTEGKRREYENYVGNKVQQYYDALFRLAEIKHKHGLFG